MRAPLLLLSGFWLCLALLMADESKAGLPGYCAIGGEEIATRIEGRLMLSPNYRTLNCTYSNGQTARVAVCEFHRYRHDALDYPIIWESIKRGWQADMDGTNWPNARRDNYWKFYEGVTIQSCDE